MLMKTLIAFGLGLLLVACAAPPPAPPVPPAAAAQPATAVDWRYAGGRSYEEQEPGMGAAHKYTSTAGSVDIYVYDLKRHDWRTGVDDPGFAAEFNSVIAAVKHLADQGNYKDLRMGAVRDTQVDGRSFRTVSFSSVREGKAYLSLAYLTAVDGKLLKYRMSFFSPVPFDVPVFVERFVHDTSALLLR